jgi:hypothetical protein
MASVVAIMICDCEFPPQDSIPLNFVTHPYRLSSHKRKCIHRLPL